MRRVSQSSATGLNSCFSTQDCIQLTAVNVEGVRKDALACAGWLKPHTWMRHAIVTVPPTRFAPHRQYPDTGFSPINSSCQPFRWKSIADSTLRASMNSTADIQINTYRTKFQPSNVNQTRRLWPQKTPQASTKVSGIFGFTWMRLTFTIRAHRT